MTFHPPAALSTDDDTDALQLLRRYYGLTNPPAPAVGAAFDGWDSTGTRAADADRFTADDLVAVTLLSVSVPGAAARRLLVDDADRFSDLLVALGPDRDLADEPEELVDEWRGWEVMAALRDLDGVGTTIASKLLARKRPRLRPIWDSVVTGLTGTYSKQWEPLRLALRDDERRLHRRLVHLGEEAGLPAEVTPLRVLARRHLLA